MDFKTLRFILLISILAMVNSAFTFRPSGRTGGDKVTRTVSRDKGGDDSGDYKLNKGYSSVYSVKDDRIKSADTHRDYKDDDTYGKLDEKFDNLAFKLNQRKNHHGGQGVFDYHDLNGQNRQDEQLDSSKSNDDYNHKYKHGYSHSHGYHHRHHHRTDDEDRDTDGDDYDGGYHHHVKIGHNKKERNNNRHGCIYDGNCKNGGYYYNDEFQYRYGDNGRAFDKDNYDGGPHDGHKDEYNHEHSLNQDHNESVDDHVPNYHYGHTQSHGNYGEDYPGFAGDHQHYRHRELDHDRTDHRHELAHRSY